MSISPDFTVTLDGRDLTSKIEPRLVRLSIRECRADEADTLDLVLEDTDGRLAIPPRGAVLAVSIGWTGSQLVDKGTFTVNEVEHSGAPDTITVRARSASMTKGMGERREKSWHGQTLAQIVKAIAARHSLTPAVGRALGAVTIDHVDQTHESDMAFLTRLAKRYDAVMTVKAGNLLFFPIGQASTASGKALPTVGLTRQDGDRHRYHVSERENYSGVRAYWYTNEGKKRKSVTVGGENTHNLKVLPETYPTEKEAETAAQSEYKRTQRSQATFSLELAEGRPDLFPELPVTVSGWKAEIDATPWLIQNVTHEIGDAGYTNSIELEMRDDPTSDKHRSHFRRGV